MSKTIEKIASSIEVELENLFSKAQISSKNCDETKYIYLLFGCILSKGICSPNAYSHNETFALYEKMLDLSLGQQYLDMKLRIALLLYCHIYESNFIPKMLYNLLTLIENGTYSEWPFPYNAKKHYDASADTKLKMIKEKALCLNLNSFVDLIDFIYDKTVRNSFFHSDYTFHPQNGIYFSVERNATTVIKTYDEMDLLLNSMFIFYETFIETWLKYKKSYSDGYKIKVPNAPLVNILMVDKDTNEVIGISQELG